VVGAGREKRKDWRVAKRESGGDRTRSDCAVVVGKLALDWPGREFVRRKRESHRAGVGQKMPGLAF
jgi:hypothetical protein